MKDYCTGSLNDAKLLRFKMLRKSVKSGAFVHWEVKGSLNSYFAFAISITGKDYSLLSFFFSLYSVPVCILLLLPSLATLAAALNLRGTGKARNQGCCVKHLTGGISVHASHLPTGKCRECIRRQRKLCVLNNWHIYYDFNRKLHVCRLKTTVG